MPSEKLIKSELVLLRWNRETGFVKFKVEAFYILEVEGVDF